MRYAGKLIEWNDDRGFGFIEPTQGGDKVFVHASAFSGADRQAGHRPRVGDRVSFELGQDAQGRKQARRAVRDDVVGLSARQPAANRPRVDGRNNAVRHRSAPRASSGSLLGRLASVALMGLLAWGGWQAWAAYGPAAQARKAVEQPAQSDSPSAAAQPLAAVFRCDGRQHCSQMTSCAEATYFLRNCPGVKMDGNNDGVPCEQQWCTSAWAR